MLKNKLAQLQQQLYQMTQPHILPYPLGFKSKDVPELYQRTAEDKLSRDSVKVPVMQDVVPEGNTAATAEMR